jgi:predicted phosphodiesterase
VHGNQTLNTVYVTEDRPDSFMEKMAKDIGARAGDVVCCGHTHKPWDRIVNGVRFINTGSVGRPKDGDWRAGYVLLSIDDAETRADFVRVAYDIDETVAAIRASDLPEEFAEQLKSGGRNTVEA